MEVFTAFFQIGSAIAFSFLFFCVVPSVLLIKFAFRNR